MFRNCIKKIIEILDKQYKHSLTLHLISLISNLAALFYIIFYYYHIRPYEFDGYQIFIICASLSFIGLSVVIFSCLIFIVLYLLNKNFINITANIINNKLYISFYYIGLLMNIIFFIISILFIFYS